MSISPGAKFGYAFGKNGGYTFGLEVSFVNFTDFHTPFHNYGLVLSFETLNMEYRLHAGIQTNFYEFENALSLFGIEMGPTYILGKTKNTLGINITPYFGAFIIPYYRLLIVPGEFTQHEVGLFLKLHIPLNGKWH